MIKSMTSQNAIVMMQSQEVDFFVFTACKGKKSYSLIFIHIGKDIPKLDFELVFIGFCPIHYSCVFHYCTQVSRSTGTYVDLMDFSFIKYSSPALISISKII